MTAFVVAMFVGIATMVLVNQAGHGGNLLSLSEYLATRGVIFGLIAGFAGFGVTNLLVSSRKSRARAWLLLGIVAAMVGLVTLSWNVSWGVPLMSLEGAWLWPLAIVPLILSIVSIGRWRRIRRSDSRVGPN